MPLATAAGQAAGAKAGPTFTGDIHIAIPRTPIGNGFDTRRAAGEIAKELKYELNKAG